MHGNYNYYIGNVPLYLLLQSELVRLIVSPFIPVQQAKQANNCGGVNFEWGARRFRQKFEEQTYISFEKEVKNNNSSKCWSHEVVSWYRGWNCLERWYWDDMDRLEEWVSCDCALEDSNCCEAKGFSLGRRQCTWCQIAVSVQYDFENFANWVNCVSYAQISFLPGLPALTWMLLLLGAGKSTGSSVVIIPDLEPRPLPKGLPHPRFQFYRLCMPSKFATHILNT